MEILAVSLNLLAFSGEILAFSHKILAHFPIVSAFRLFYVLESLKPLMLILSADSFSFTTELLPRIRRVSGLLAVSLNLLAFSGEILAFSHKILAHFSIVSAFRLFYVLEPLNTSDAHIIRGLIFLYNRTTAADQKSFGVTRGFIEFTRVLWGNTRVLL